MLAVSLQTQSPVASVRIEARFAGSPVADAVAVASGMTYRTDAGGIVVLNVSPGTTDITVVKEGLAPMIVSVEARANETRTVGIDLEPQTSRIRDPVHVERTGMFVLTNLTSPATNTGIEWLKTWRHSPFSVTAAYGYVRAFEREAGTSVQVPLTPRYTAGLVAIWERPESGRAGIEWYYTGVQRLDANPYRTEGRSYMVVGALVERRIGRYRLFLNAENLGDVRQTRWDPLLLLARAADGRWTRGPLSTAATSTAA